MKTRLTEMLSIQYPIALIVSKQAEDTIYASNFDTSGAVKVAYFGAATLAMRKAIHEASPSMAPRDYGEGVAP
jgi:hypothetical protein